MDFDIPKMPKREQNSNKGTFGKILNIAGSKYMPGAAYLSSISALKIGAGYVELASDENTLNIVANKACEIVLCPLEKIENVIGDVQVISIGCGLSTDAAAVDIFNKVISLRDKQLLIIDADGLNILSQTNLRFCKNTVLTPHPKEASRLLKCDLKDVLNDLEGSAKEISKNYNCVTVLKTHNTIVTEGEKIYTNQTGCSALAKAGSGDILCGMIAGLAAQGLDVYSASKLGVYLHGLAGDLAAKDLTEYAVLASDLVRYIPFAIKNYTN